MEKDNCLICMYSEYDELTVFINELMNSNKTTCNNKNSPYFRECVSECNTCRLFVDSIKYFSQKDRKDKLDNLKNNNFNNFD